MKLEGRNCRRLGREQPMFRMKGNPLHLYRGGGELEGMEPEESNVRRKHEGSDAATEYAGGEFVGIEPKENYCKRKLDRLTELETHLKMEVE